MKSFRRHLPTFRLQQSSATAIKTLYLLLIIRSKLSEFRIFTELHSGFVTRVQLTRSTKKSGKKTSPFSPQNSTRFNILFIPSQSLRFTVCCKALTRTTRTRPSGPSRSSKSQFRCYHFYHSRSELRNLRLEQKAL